jgi:radical SAM protein with 4Fe4S-binding SPASM domain
MLRLPERVALASPFTRENVKLHHGLSSWADDTDRLTVRTRTAPWGYATLIRFSGLDTSSFTRHVVRIQLRTIAGEVGVGILGASANELFMEQLVRPSAEPHSIELCISDISTCTGVMIRNGSQAGESVVEIDGVDVYVVPQTSCDIGADDVLAGFIESCDTAPDAHTVVWPGLDVNLTPDSLRLVRLGPGRSLSPAALGQILDTAARHGYAITSKTNAHGTVIAVKESLAGGLQESPHEWPVALLARSEARYQEAVAEQYKQFSGAVSESMQIELADVIRPAQESVVFELANACNLACPFCPRNGRKIKDGLMKAEDAKRIITDIASTSQKFIFYPHYLGETLIHPRIFEVIDHALSFPNVEVHCISNGILLDERRREELLKRNITNYNFSIHECDQVGQEGVGSEEALSTRHVLAFLQQLSDLGRRESTYVSVSMVPKSFQDPAIPRFLDYWLGITNQVTFYACVDLDRTLNDDAEKPPVRMPCTAPWRAPVIAYDGSVLPCCWDYEHTMVMGNIFERSWDAIWSGEPFVKLRTALLRNDLADYPSCVNCEKWQQWVPGLPSVRLDDYYYTSNGTFKAYGALALKPELLRERLAGLPGAPRWKHLPIYRKPKNYVAPTA